VKHKAVAKRLKRLFDEGEFDDSSDLKAKNVKHAADTSAFVASIDGQKFLVTVSEYKGRA